MATLALSSIGGAVGGSFLPSISVFGQTLTGAALGQAAGAIAGRYVDQTLFATSGQPRIVEGPRLEDLNLITSQEGANLPRIYGRARIAGQIIWASDYEEQVIKRKETSSSGNSKGGNSSSQAATTETIEYRYFANFAVALCEGEVTRLGRVWVNGEELNLSNFTYRFYKGTDDQPPDSLIESHLGASATPAYRGTCYIVFERMPLAEFGNRIPQLNFEVFRSFDQFEQGIRAINLIPGAGEYIYEKTELIKSLGAGFSEPLNTHTNQGGSDWQVSLNQLQADLPNVEHISLIVSWFANDLRVANCILRPAVDNRETTVSGRSWQVSGETRASAHLISEYNDRPSYGGTPSDETVIGAIVDLKERGLKVTFNPFILMDIPENNNRVDPYSSATNQPTYPWRGRITINPAPGQLGSNDKTAAALEEMRAFIGNAVPTDFNFAGEAVTYTGPSEWSYRRMALHYAHLCKAAGGVDTFLIGSEMRGLTSVRASQSSYPFVDALVSLASDVKAILGADTKVTYAADWSEYFGHQPSDGTGDVYFHLDKLWSSADIDAIGIDCYWPLSDWRDGETHLDKDAGASSIYDLDYLCRNIAGGEGFDWYYQDAADRSDQIRTLISDSQGKPWVFRYKDLKSWWQNQHFDRPGGIESATPTAWQPASKPIWFTEFGCPAIDKGSNQPNLFIDPKSSESNLPYFSNASPDDFIQRRYIQALNRHFNPADPDFALPNNPVSTLYGGNMVDPERLYAYAWDARPYPAFPGNDHLWGDAENWLRGHWLTGRAGSLSLSALVAKILEDFEFHAFDASSLDGIIDGYVIDRIMSARGALQPLELAYFFDTLETSNEIRFVARGKSALSLALVSDDLVEISSEESLYNFTRAQETELPGAAKLSFIDADSHYRKRAVQAKYIEGQSRRVATADLPIITDAATVQNIAERWVQEGWIGRESASFALPPSMIRLEPTDIVEFSSDGITKQLRITEINDQLARTVQASAIQPELYNRLIENHQLPENALPEIYGPSEIEFYDFPLLTGGEVAHAGFIGAAQSPWPGSVVVYRSPQDDSYLLNRLLDAPSLTGNLKSALYEGPEGRFDYANSLYVRMHRGTLQSLEKVSMLEGGNLAAVRHDNDLWEIIQFLNAELVGEGTYRLSNLLRAQLGTNDALATRASLNAPFVLIDEALRQVNMSVNEIGREFNWRYGPGKYDIGHTSFQTKQYAFTARGLRPLSPVHIKATPKGNDLAISWVRRGRIGADRWDLGEIPLGEAFEAYEVDILDQGNVKRTISTTSESCLYTEAEQLLDWGNIQPNYEIQVAQLSELYGRGTYASATINSSQ